MPTPALIVIIVFAVLIVVLLTVVCPILSKKEKEIYEKMKNGTAKELEQIQFLLNLKETVNKTSNQNSTVKYCEYCGAEIVDGSNTCSSCGKKKEKVVMTRKVWKVK